MLITKQKSCFYGASGPFKNPCNLSNFSTAPPYKKQHQLLRGAAPFKGTIYRSLTKAFGTLGTISQPKEKLSINDYNQLRFFLADFVEIQRKSFFFFLEKGLIEEFNKRNPIINLNKELSLAFYPSYYKLTPPEYNPREAILKNKSYTSKLYMPVQLTDYVNGVVKLKWVYIGNLPLMTKRGHFILNGAPRVIVNQIIRSPGIYYQEKLHENFTDKWSQKPEMSFKRYYADLICLRGTWLRFEIDKEKNIWAQMKKGPKIPAFWFLIGLGIPERIIFRSIYEPHRLIQNMNYNGRMSSNSFGINDTSTKLKNTLKVRGLKASLKDVNKKINKLKTSKGPLQTTELREEVKPLTASRTKNNYAYVKNPPEAWRELYNLVSPRKSKEDKNTSDLGRNWLFNKFMNPRTYDLGKQGRYAFNKKLGLNLPINQSTLTGIDLLYTVDNLIKVEKGLKKIDDIDHLKNRRVRTSGELLQIQVGIALVRLEKIITEKMVLGPKLNYINTGRQKALKNSLSNKPLNVSGDSTNKQSTNIDINQAPSALIKENLEAKFSTKNEPRGFVPYKLSSGPEALKGTNTPSLNILINSKAFNSVLREFFGTSPLSQFMDQINPLAEITHKRRLTSMGPGGVTRDNATMAIRGIHPTHYGRICPIETPEGKNTGLVNSMTAYAKVNSQGILESPFYKVYKGFVLKSTGIYYLSAEQEEKMTLAAADLFISSIGFLPKSSIPVRINEDFLKIQREAVQYISISTLQMISIATSLIPFLEHDDANRALMGSNMQRQAVPLIRPERPIVGTGLEARAVSDSGHIIQTKYSGIVTYVSSNKIRIQTLSTY